jgi:puromycin-sensitive aminopeptidase
VFSALGAAPSAALKQRTLDWTISGEIKLQDFFYPMGGVSGSGKLGSDLAFAFFKANFQKLKTMLAAASPSLMNAVIVYTCGASACAFLSLSDYASVLLFIWRFVWGVV